MFERNTQEQKILNDSKTISLFKRMYDLRQKLKQIELNSDFTYRNGGEKFAYVFMPSASIGDFYYIETALGKRQFCLFQKKMDYFRFTYSDFSGNIIFELCIYPKEVQILNPLYLQGKKAITPQEINDAIIEIENMTQEYYNGMETDFKYHRQQERELARL